MKTHFALILLALGMSLFFQNCAPPTSEEETVEVHTPASLSAEVAAANNTANQSAPASATTMSSQVPTTSPHSTANSQSQTTQEAANSNPAQNPTPVSGDVTATSMTSGAQSSSSTSESSSVPSSQNTEATSGAVPKRTIDMVWVVDNSGGMASSAENLRKKLGPFAKDLATKSDLKIALITKNGNEGTGISLPAGLNGLQVSHNVQSSELLLLAAVSLCKSPSNDAFCISFASGKYQTVHGTLNSFFRSNSEKFFIFVSDDDSVGTAANENKNFITASTMLKQLETEFAKEALPKVYSIISGSKNCGVRKGTEYLKLVKETSGAAFDICATDWSAYFTKLIADLETK